MSGHSHWATTKRAKGAKDAVKGKLFSKITRAISIAAKSGTDPNSNSKLRVAIDLAKSVNMPKDNIDRAIAKGSKSDVQLDEVSYEGFGPGGIGVIVEAATDNRNRTSAEIKNIFERNGGSLGGPGSVAFNFDPVGLIVVEKTVNADEQILNLIDLGISDMEEVSGEIEVYVNPSDLARIKETVEGKGYKVKSYDLIKKPKSYISLDDRESAKKAQNLLEDLEEDEDVQRLFTNADIPSGALN